MDIQIQILKSIANEICKEFEALCYEHFNELSLLEDYLLFIGTWIESFYYIDPAECVSDENCALKILDMHGEVFPLAIRNQYVINIDENLFRKAVENLLKLK
jgi:fructosamine-3-kinase